jgi:hypothetical protein
MKACRISLLAVVGGLTAFVACSEESSGDDDDATTTTTTTTTTTSTTTTATGNAGTIEVTQDTSTQVVDLGTLPSVTCGAVQCVAVDDIILAAFPSVTIASISADFVASDGFTPASSPNCTSLVPVAGSNLDKGSVTVITRTLAWEASLSYPGCLKVDDLAEIIISP